MKFVHIADTHFDSPFTNLVRDNSFGEIRRLDKDKYSKNNKLYKRK